MKNYTIIPNELLDRSILSPQVRYLLCVLKRFAGQDDYCYPSQQTLSRIMLVSERHIRNYIHQLKKAKIISVKRTGFNKSNTYHLYLKDQNHSSDQSGIKVPDNPGITLPTKSTYRKATNKKGLESVRNTLEKLGLKPPKDTLLEKSYNKSTHTSAD